MFYNHTPTHGNMGTLSLDHFIQMVFVPSKWIQEMLMERQSTLASLDGLITSPSTASVGSVARELFADDATYQNPNLYSIRIQ